MNIDFIIGDYYHDGHGNYEKFTIDSSLDHIALQKAYNEGYKIAGFDITEYCHEYDDSLIPLKHIKKLLELGLEKDREVLESVFNEEDEEYSLTPEEYIHIYLFICHLGNDHFIYTLENENPQINIGGYGLFY